MLSITREEIDPTYTCGTWKTTLNKIGGRRWKQITMPQALKVLDLRRVRDNLTRRAQGDTKKALFRYRFRMWMMDCAAQALNDHHGALRDVMGDVIIKQRGQLLAHRDGNENWSYNNRLPKAVVALAAAADHQGDPLNQIAALLRFQVTGNTLSGMTALLRIVEDKWARQRLIEWFEDREPTPIPVLPADTSVCQHCGQKLPAKKKPAKKAPPKRAAKAAPKKVVKKTAKKVRKAG